MPNFGYHAARAKGAIARRLYGKLLPLIVRAKRHSASPIPIDVFSYSGEASVPEQVRSILSFVRHAGRPNRFVVVSDGSHSPASIDLLQQSDVSVQVRLSMDRQSADEPPNLRSYLANHPTGKQLAVIMSLPEQMPALYADSDILFFPRAANLRCLLSDKARQNYYLADCQMAGDQRLFKSDNEQTSPVNTGLLLIGKPLDWHLGISRFLDLHGAEPTFFTNQTITHLTMHANGAIPFDSSEYVLSLEDQFIFHDLYAGENIAARHYVTPVRHKMWSCF